MNTDRPLSGKRIGFYTSVVGMGGSEVLVADAMEAASASGAEVICWSEGTAAIRRITSARSQRFQVEHRIWPPSAVVPTTVNEPTPASHAPAPGPARRGVKDSLLALVPFAVKRYLGFRKMATAFRQELISARPDLLFVNVNGSEAVSLAGPAFGVPVVNCYHLSYTHPGGGWLDRIGDHRARRETIRSGQLTVHTSQAVRDQWCHQYKYPVERTCVVYNGVDPPPPADRAATRKALGVPDGQFVFCVPGRLDAMKGHRHLFEALRQCVGRLPPFTLLVCGDGGLRRELEARSRETGLTDRVRFLGWRTDLPMVLQASDAIVLPSVESENLSVAVLEGLMAGIPAVVTAVGGMAEAVRNGESGYVVPPADPVALAAALVRMATDAENNRRMGKAAAADARNRFTRTRMMDEYVGIFREVLGTRGT